MFSRRFRRACLWDRVLNVLTVLIISLSAILLLSSLLDRVFDLGGAGTLDKMKCYGGGILIGLSGILALLCRLILSHPLYEYYFVFFFGIIIGGVYAF